jgi:hypothetical protein
MRRCRSSSSLVLVALGVGTSACSLLGGIDGDYGLAGSTASSGSVIAIGTVKGQDALLFDTSGTTTRATAALSEGNVRMVAGDYTGASAAGDGSCAGTQCGFVRLVP